MPDIDVVYFDASNTEEHFEKDWNKKWPKVKIYDINGEFLEGED